MLSAALAAVAGWWSRGADSLPIARSPADRWPGFRGNAQMTGLAGGALPDKLELLWSVKKENDSFEATAAIADGVVYLPGMNGAVFALALDTGKEFWTFPSKDLDGVKSSPCLDADSVYYGDSVGNFRSLDRKTGAPRWQFPARGEIISSATLLDGKILFGCYDGKLYCLDAKSGKPVWELTTDAPVHCSPALVGDEVVVAGCDGFLHFVSVKTGKQTRQMEIGGNIASTPAVVGDRLFLGTISNLVIGVDAGKQQRLWTYEHPDRKFEFYSSAALANDVVIIGGRDKLLHCIEQATGKTRWEFPAKAKIDASPVVVGNRVFVGTTNGTLWGVDLATGKAAWDYVTGSSIKASAAVASERMIVGTEDGTILCFGKKN